MIRINENYLNLQDSYLFSTINAKVKKYEQDNPKTEIIKLGIGDVTRPLPKSIIKAMHLAVDEMGKKDTFKGYGPEQGYDFLKEKIIEFYYNKYGINLEKSEIFISDGAKCDCANIIELFSNSNLKIGILNPVYPVYIDSNVMNGNAGNYNKEEDVYENIVYIPLEEKNNFKPVIPDRKVDIIYLCYPNNPTGTTLTKEELKMWIDYALENNSVILYDAAYEAYITEDNVPHSIYEIDNAKKVAIEFKSYSKTAGFTGIRCAYTIVPNELFGYTNENVKISINKLWNRRQCTKFNGCSYISQKAAEAIYLKDGIKQIRENIDYYMRNAKYIKESLQELGYKVYGGVNSPYIWLKTPNNMKSWDFFDILLKKANVVGTPGVGFGSFGEGYFRLTGFNTYKNSIIAMKRISNIKI